MRKKSKKRILIAGILVLCLVITGIVLLKVHRNDVSGVLQITFLDVGQGDAIFLQNGEHRMLIDGGTAGNSSYVYSFLKQREIQKLDYLICTHPHEDHVGGLSGALQYAEPETVLCSVSEYEGDAFETFLKQLNKKNLGITIPEEGQQYQLGDAFFSILSCSSSNEDVNDRSLVIWVQFGKNSFLLQGDAGTEIENEILSKDPGLTCDVLKIGHHGSDSATSESWLNALKPEYAVLSVGKDNAYGHPDLTVLQRLKCREITLYRTDMQGEITCTSDGKSIVFSCENNDQGNTYEEIEESTVPSNSKETYYLNEKSMKFHKPSCAYAQKIDKDNLSVVRTSREKLIKKGYSPCGSCQP